MKLLKKLILALLIAAAPISMVALVGCTTTQQTTAYKTLYSVETSTTAAYDGYLSLLIKGSVATNGAPTVASYYNKFQGSFRVALSLAENNTNALAPINLITESQDVINLINQFTGKKP